MKMVKKLQMSVGPSGVRSVNIGFVSKYADATLESQPGTEGHLFASFQAGLTMTHEFGHWFF
jgi:hypothetical protein